MGDGSVPHYRKPWLPLLATLILMIGLGALVGWQWQALEARNRAGHLQRFDLAVDGIEHSLIFRMRAYEMVLRGMAGLMAGHEQQISAEEWQRATDLLQLQKHYPGIQALGWARYLHNHEQLDVFLRSKPDGFQMLPQGARNEYLVVDYISPLDWRNRRALGYDGLTEPIRRQAVEQARDSGEVVLSGPLRLRQETEENAQVGVVLLLPVYRPEMPITNVEERRAALLGIVFGAFRVQDLMLGVLGSRSALYRLELHDRADAGAPPLNGRVAMPLTPRFQSSRTLSLYGRDWQLTVSSTPGYEASLNGGGHLSFSLWSGLLAALLLALLVGGYLYQRERAQLSSQLLGERLHEREERFRLVVEASPNALVLVDSAGRIAMVNRQTELLFGYGREEMLGQPVEMLLPEALRAGHVALRQGYLENPEPRRMGSNRELFGQHRDGRSIPLEVGLAPLRSGEDRLVQASIIDISERKAAAQRLSEQAEQLALASRYKSEFLANMSHELRTPLNSILILSDQLKHNAAGNLSEKQVMHADIVHRAGSDLLQLINDVLDLAKVEAGRVQLMLEPLNMHDLLAELDASLRPLAELKGLRLLTSLEPEVPRVIRSDRVRLHQILRNLLANAVKFTEQGEVELRVSSTSLGPDEARVMLYLTVRDTGIGIAAEQHERIFHAFQQLDGSTSRRFGGTGLGLAITRQLVEVLDGEISLESTPGHGACFSVQLPVAVVAPVSTATSISDVSALAVSEGFANLGEADSVQVLRQSNVEVSMLQAGPLDGRRVLLVDDDMRNLYAMSALLDEVGLQVTPAKDGLEAIACFARGAFDLILMDIAMPSMDGYSAMRVLKYEQGCRVPIIALTAHAMKGDREKCLAAGADDYLAKPVARRELLDLLYRWLDRPGGRDDAPAA